jgi:phosphoglycolate phosphatase
VPERELGLVRAQGLLYPHARETLVELRRDGCRTALLTNAGSPYIEVIMSTFDLAPLFDELSTFQSGEASKTVRLRGILGRLGGPPAVMVGDRRFDFEAAREVGIPSVGVSHGYGHEELGLADVVIDDLWQLVEMRRAARLARAR